MDRHPHAPRAVPRRLAGAALLATLTACATGPRPLDPGEGAADPMGNDAYVAASRAAPDVHWCPMPVATIADLNGDGVADQVYVGDKDFRVVLGLVTGPYFNPGRVRLIHLPVRAGSPCGGRTTVDTERVRPPLVKLGCEGATQAPGCADVRAGAAFARTHPGIRGLRVAAGRGPAFHVYWDPSASDFAWWRR